MKPVAGISITIGTLILVQWIVFLASHQVPEVHTAPIALGLHLAAEVATALALITAGIGLFREHARAITLGLVAHGMLLYTIIVSSGYFAQQGQWGFIAMFSVLLVTTLACIRVLAGKVR